MRGSEQLGSRFLDLACQLPTGSPLFLALFRTSVSISSSWTLSRKSWSFFRSIPNRLPKRITEARVLARIASLPQEKIFLTMKIMGGMGRGHIVLSHDVAPPTAMFHEYMVRYCDNFGFVERLMITVSECAFAALFRLDMCIMTTPTQKSWTSEHVNVCKTT